MDAKQTKKMGRKLGKYLGEFDDYRYVEELKKEFSQPPVKETKKVEPAKPKQFRAMIDKVFENPDESSVEDLRSTLQKEEATQKAMFYFTDKANEFYEKQQKLIAETL